MKKILLTAAAVSVLATSSAYAKENSYYAKVNAGWSKLNKIRSDSSTRMKSNNDAHIGIGAGYYVMDKFRAELMLDHYINPTHKSFKKNNIGESLAIKLKSDANTLLLNGFVDVFETNDIKLFVGAGIGASYLKGKVTAIEKNAAGATVDTETNKFKSQYKFAFAGYVGAGYEFTQGVTGELAYSYKNLGKLGKNKDYKGTNAAQPELRGHHVTAGVRFDI